MPWSRNDDQPKTTPSGAVDNPWAAARQGARGEREDIGHEEEREHRAFGRAAPLGPHKMSFAGAPLTLGLIVFMSVIELASVLSPALRLEARVDYAISTIAIELFLHGQMPVNEMHRFVTHAFLHGFPLHLLLNMAVLAILGPPAERALGVARYGLFFLIVAVAGAFGQWGWDAAAAAIDGTSILASTTVDYRIPLVGASGAIFGVLAIDMWTRASAIRAAPPELRRRLPSPQTYLVRNAGMIIALNVAIGLVGLGISGAAHIGGFVVGLALAPLLAPHRPAFGGP